MKLLDSNIFIYAASGAHDYLHSFLEDEKNACSIIACIEVLGFPRLKPDEKEFYLSAFEALNVIPLTEEVKKKSIILHTSKPKNSVFDKKQVGFPTK